MVLRTLLAHYLRHPMQGLFLITGIVIANVLLIGTQLINAQARASYAQGEQILGAGPVGYIVAVDERASVDEALFVHLRRQGFEGVAPMLREIVRTRDGDVLELMGVDALSMPRQTHFTGASQANRDDVDAQPFGGFAFPPYQLVGATSRLRQLNIEPGTQLHLVDGTVLPPAMALDAADLGHRLLIDLGALQQLRGSAGKLSALLVFENEAYRIEDLLAALPAEVRYEPQASAPDPARLTESFHLNLAAMGLLASVVGLFLTYNAIAFSYTDRRELLRRLRLTGVSRRTLATALVCELLIFLVTGGALGLWLGATLAAALLPGVGQTLAQLFGVYINYPDSLLAQGYLMPLAIIGTAAVLCTVSPLRQALSAPLLARHLESWRLASAARRDRRLIGSGVMLLTLSGCIALAASTTWMALCGMACLLLGAALTLPRILRYLIDGLAHLLPERDARAGWVLADARWLLGPAALALMAMTLALVANSGLNTMIGSFRSATDAWLAQRLGAQLYLVDSDRVLSGNVAFTHQWLARQAPGVGMALRFRTEQRFTTPDGANVPVEIVDLADAPPFRDSVQLLRGLPDARARFEAGQGIYISERAWRLDGWQIGDPVAPCADAAPVTVLGVYHDYGNPKSQWMLPPALFNACWPQLFPAGVAFYGSEDIDWGTFQQQLIGKFGLADNTITNQRQLRGIAMQVFDRTFAVTRALNLLTLLVAGIGIFCAVSAIHHHRIGQQALLASLGVSRGERAILLILQWGLIGGCCTLLVWPFGLSLAWYLSAVVTPAAFGWSFPLRLELAPYLQLAGVACIAVILAVAVPSLRLLRVSPAAMLREQTG